jgi:ABC-type oligopeptide transport system substrate-binding subunit
MDAPRQRLAPVRRLAACAAVALLAGCGSSGPEPNTGPTLRLALPSMPQTVDPALAADLPSVNVAHELYAGLTRFSGTGVVPDLAESWYPSQNGLVWTFRLRKGLHWSDGRPITASDFRDSWTRALSPAMHSAYARAEMQNIKGARRYLAGGGGNIGVEALDDRTLRVTLEHPVPWFDEQVAYPVFFPAARRGAFSGPFRLDSRSPSRLTLARNDAYWNAGAVEPRRLVLGTSTRNVDGILPGGVAAPGFPWVQTGESRGGPELDTLAVELLWFVTRGTQVADPGTRRYLAWLLTHLDLGSRPVSLIPKSTPGASEVNSHRPVNIPTVSRPLHLTLAYTTEDVQAVRIAAALERATSQLKTYNVELTLKAVPTLRDLVALTGPPAKPGIDLVLLGWSSEFFDAYNILDLFPCASAFNVARWCDRSYDRLMQRAVRTLDDHARWRIERRIVEKLHEEVPATPLAWPVDHFSLRPGVHGFSWSPIGVYELSGLTRS